MNFFKTTFVFLFLICTQTVFAADWDITLKQAILENNVEEVKRCLEHVDFDLEDVLFYEFRENLGSIRFSPEQETSILAALKNSLYDPELMSIEDILKSIGIQDSESSRKLIILELLLNARTHREYNSFSVLETSILRDNTFIFQYMLLRQTDLYHVAPTSIHRQASFIQEFEFDLDSVQTDYTTLSFEDELLLIENFKFLKIFLENYKGNKIIQKYQGIRFLKLFFTRFYSHYLNGVRGSTLSHYKKIMLLILNNIGTHINDRNIAGLSLADIALEPLILFALRNQINLLATSRGGWIPLTLEGRGANLQEALERITDPSQQIMIQSLINFERGRRNRELEFNLLEIIVEDNIAQEENSWINYFYNIARVTLIAPLLKFQYQNP